MGFAIIMLVGMAILIFIDHKLTIAESIRKGTDNKKFGADYYDDTDDKED